MTDRMFLMILGIHLLSVLIGYLLIPKNKGAHRIFLILILSVIVLEIILGIVLLKGVPPRSNIPMGEGFADRLAMMLVSLIVHVIFIIFCLMMRILRKDK